MQKDLIVAVFTPTKGGSGASKGALSGVVGTGYPVSDDLILTSRHVVEPENRDRRANIRVLWYYDTPPTGTTPVWTSIKKDDLVWTGEGDLDAALIRCPRPASLRRFSLGRLVERRPRPKEEWESSGFARANKLDDERKTGPFSGKLRGMAEGDPFFELIEEAEPANKDLWSGVSGMPVFVGSEILGIVKHIPPNYGHKKLEAVPAWRLLQDPGFQKALGREDEGQLRVQRARQLLLRLLSDSEAATRDLAAELNPERVCGDIRECRDWLVETLLNETPSLDRLFATALRVQNRQRVNRDQTGARVATDLVLTILPAIQEAAVLTEVSRCNADSSVCPIALPTKLRTLAEIIMAGADKRGARLRPMRNKIDDPDGEASLQIPPESGRDRDNQQIRSDWNANLISMFADGGKRFSGAFRGYLNRRFIPSHLRPPYSQASEQELLNTVKAQLRYEAEESEDRLTYYFIAPMPSDPKARATQDAILKELKDDFPHIAFLTLSGTEDLGSEWPRYAKLRDLLFKDQEMRA